MHTRPYHGSGQQLEDDQAYRLRGAFGDSIVLPPTMLQWVISQPETSLSAKWAQLDALNIPITFLRSEIGTDPLHEPVVRRDLTANLDRLEDVIWEEVGSSLELIWGKQRFWCEVNLDHTIRRIVGSSLCQQDDYIENCIRYVTQVSTIVGVIATIPIRTTYAACSKYLVPHFLSTPSPERTPDLLSRRIMALNFATIHTSTMTTCNLLLDIASQPSTLSMLREESQTSNARWNDSCTRARLNQMYNLDSALRESLRLWGPVPKAMTRKVIHQDGISLPTGQHLPQGVTVCVSGWGLHHDNAIYPRGYEFVHDRFKTTSQQVTLDGSQDKKTTPRKSLAAAETDESFATWGIGKHACPGRFFAVDLIKIIVSRILLDYEIKIQEKRPDNVWIEYNIIPPPNAMLRVRRRIGAPKN
ncbi:cytochrome P450 [Nemania diffusa]|nr:cytochrome P450 [Nemania diffusa]